MYGLATLALVFPFLAGATTTDFGAAVDTEGSAGILPRGANVQGEDAARPLGADATARIIAGMRVYSERTTFILSYGPELRVELPGTVAYGRPLVLHVLSSSLDTALTPRTQLTFNLNGGAGEVSYGSLEQVFAPGSGRVNARFIPLIYADGTANLGHQTGRRNTVALILGAGYRSPLGELSSDDEASVSSDITTSYNTSAAFSDSYQLTARDQLSVAIQGGFLASQEAASASSRDFNEVLVVGAVVGWNRSLSNRSNISYSLGGAVSYALSESEVALRGGASLEFIPTATVNYNTGWRVGRQTWSNTIGGGLRGFLDRVSATYRTQAFASWALNGRIGRDWLTGGEFFASTSVMPEPLDPPNYESTLTIGLPTSYRISNSALVNFGLRGELRAPHIRNDTPLKVQRELTAFVGFRYSLGTDKNMGQWLP